MTTDGNIKNIIIQLAALIAVGLLTSTAQAQCSVQDRLDQYGESARARLLPYFEDAGIAYPPINMRMVAFKYEGVLQLFAMNERGEWTFIRDYAIQGASGVLGPKLMKGDRQVPEGFYRISLLNPNSAYHLSLRVDYPNEYDQVQAALEGRSNLGGDIMIHGSNSSRGCLAMGDEAIEEIFVLAADTDIRNIDLIITPVDFRSQPLPANYCRPLDGWVSDLYFKISDSLQVLPAPLVPVTAGVE